MSPSAHGQSSEVKVFPFFVENEHLVANIQDISMCQDFMILPLPTLDDHLKPRKASPVQNDYLKYNRIIGGAPPFAHFSEPTQIHFKW